MPIGPDTDIEFMENMIQEFLVTFRGEFGDIDLKSKNGENLVRMAISEGAKYVYRLEKAHPGNCAQMFGMLGYEKKDAT